MAKFQIIEKVGGIDKAFEIMQSRCGVEHKKTVFQWLARGRISGDGITALMAECDARGISYTSRDFEASE